MNIILQTGQRVIFAFLSMCLSALLIIVLIYFYLDEHLPDVSNLQNVQYQVPMQIYTSDKKLIGTFGGKYRLPVKFDEVPIMLANAFVAIEDHRFYSHLGVDFIGFMRAAKSLLKTGRKSQGASTITMQVARNFFLTKQKTFTRKFKEILLALKIDQSLSKEEILTLYMNKIYLGQGAYGVAAAAKIYYGKQLKDLTLPQIAMIAGLPQGPSKSNPISAPKRALARRNQVLLRLWQNKYISKEMYKKAILEPITAKLHRPKSEFYAPYIAETVRRKLKSILGEAVYTSGIHVYTTINSKLQRDAQLAIITGLLNYDQRHGYRGALDNWGKSKIENIQGWSKKLKKIPTYSTLQPAVIIDVEKQQSTALLKNGNIEIIPWEGIRWARKTSKWGWPGKELKSAKSVLKEGDLVYLSRKNNFWNLAQVPKIEGAIISISPKNGEIKSLVGGFSFKRSHFNRATQAKRQAGSSFKPFIYSAALNKGLTLATVYDDSPIVLTDSGINAYWRPSNVSHRFHGSTSLREALIHSRNIVSIKILQDIGIPYTLDYLKRFGFNPERLPHSLSLALGSGLTSPTQLAVGYTTFANGGYRIRPHMINKIIDQRGEIVFEASPLTAHKDAAPVLSPENAFLINDALKDVIQNGTATKAKRLNRKDISGKTGTTNDMHDAWFIGYHPHLVTAVWVGFDIPKSIHEYGAQAALPIWIDYMQKILPDLPVTISQKPPSIITARINPQNGLLANPNNENAIYEIFRAYHAPKETEPSKSQNQEDSLEYLF